MKPESVVVIQCDIEARRVDRFSAFDLPDKLEIEGCDGTMFSPMFEEVRRQILETRRLIYNTDMFCDDFPKEYPDYPVLWTSYGGEYSEKPPFREVIEIACGTR